MLGDVDRDQAPDAWEPKSNAYATQEREGSPRAQAENMINSGKNLAVDSAGTMPIVTIKSTPPIYQHLPSNHSSPKMSFQDRKIMTSQEWTIRNGAQTALGLAIILP